MRQEEEIGLWQLPPIDLALSPHEVHLWRASLDQPVAMMQSLMQILSEEEQARARRFRRDSDRHHFAVGRGLLRLILGRYLAIAPQQLQFCYGAHGKPALVNAAERQNLQFNLSHSQELALYAITCDRQIGVDLEQIRALADVEQLTHRFFSAREYADFCALPLGQRLDAFFHGWTCKEAYLKAIGKGLTQLEQVEVSLIPDAPARLLSIAQDRAIAAQWSLQTLKPASNYVAALAVEGHNWTLTRWQYSAPAAI